MCIIDHDNKLIYIAIPKTGTTSTQAFLQKIISDNSIVVNSNKPNNIGLCKHSSAKTISSIIENYSDYHSIAVIRNPYDWYVSWFTFRQRDGAGISSKNMSFKEYLNKQPMKQLLSWICDDNDNIIVNSIIKYEDGIEDQMKNIISKIFPKNITSKMPKVNISKKRQHKDYKIYYNDETKKIVENLQSKTLQKFGYQF
tara:strand:- start:1523 stop:2116 length:594 start_codon:yes stop_codon:yes gene_type:complete